MRIGSIPFVLAVAALVAEPVAAQRASAVPPPPVAAQSVDDAVPEDYKPQDKDERGLWMQMDEAERHLKVSQQVIRDPVLNDYVRKVFCRTVGPARCAPIRIYLIRTSHFNASMAPNGMMQVWSGLLLRTRNEAQLAAVLGHEYAHFEKRHTLKLFRQVRSKSASATWLAFTGIGLVASFGLLADIFHYSREMEQEADLGGLDKMVAAGYDTREAAKIWEQLREEMDATAAARQTKSRKDKDGGLFADHPPSAARVAYLAQAAVARPGTVGATGADTYVTTMDRYLPQFIDDQLKQNDFGASDYLINALGHHGWTDWLRYAEGELYRRRAGEGDLNKAVDFYGEGMTITRPMPELWRGRGLALLKLGRSNEGKADLKEYLKQASDAPDKAMIAMMAGE